MIFPVFIALKLVFLWLLFLCVDFSQLWPQEERHQQGANVLNGISVSADEDIIYVTGKYWDRMFKIR